MIGMCQKCHKSGMEITKTTVLISEIGSVDVPLCAKCRNN
jgi:hypothetical protein